MDIRRPSLSSLARAGLPIGHLVPVRHRDDAALIDPSSRDDALVDACVISVHEPSPARARQPRDRENAGFTARFSGANTA